MSYWIVDGRQLTNEEYQELQRQQQLEKQRAREEEARLSRQLSDAYEALKEHLSRHKGISQHITDERALEQKIYEKLQQNLDRANEAPRCAAVKEDGTMCGSPKMNDHIYCFAHRQMMKGRAKKLWLPPLEDANAIQMAVMLVQRALIDDEISEKKAGLLLYSIQIAAANVHKTTFGQAKDEDMVTETSDEGELIREHEEEMQRKSRNLPLIATGDTDRKIGEQGLPRMDADGRGSEKQNSPLMNADEEALSSQQSANSQNQNLETRSKGGSRGEEAGAQTLPAMNTDETDLNGGTEKILPQSVGNGPEVYANRGEIAEVHANLG